jgi:hypothetical protein
MPKIFSKEEATTTAAAAATTSGIHLVSKSLGITIAR